MRDDAVDLGRLNEAERIALGLLAQGHTVKSIAAITGKSVGSVNERLREARRKTGVGSSRVLARLFAAQKNRDEIIGVDAASDLGPTLGQQAAMRGLGWKRGLVMITILGGSIAAIAMMMVGQQADPVTDPMVGVFMVPSDHPDSSRDYYIRLRAEARDDSWAADAEARLRKRYGAIPGIAGGKLRVTCRATLCEVAGLQVGVQQPDRDPIEKVGGTLRGQGFAVAMTAMNNLGINPQDMKFLIYFKRISASAG